MWICMVGVALLACVTLQTFHFILHALHFHSTLLHSTLYIPHSSLCTYPSYTLHSTLPTSHLKLNTPHFTLYTPHFTLYSLQSIHYIPHFARHTLPHSRVYGTGMARKDIQDCSNQLFQTIFYVTVSPCVSTSLQLRCVWALGFVWAASCLINKST